MAAAQSYAAACLALLSLNLPLAQALLEAGAIRHLSPLLESRVALARGYARQVNAGLAAEEEGPARKAGGGGVLPCQT